ncbi:PTS ascorbate transporter subunit IIC [Senegalia massiliensis]|uniref:Ascorbate-specific PTS system EIIC component n=1 Tax=Senegalia massiliensis TaxID=1720316 RepID=A0A845R0C6_9CLOT|nr:PTS ascorbate transporter subunit IIC [Senegalia massiliensis]NBI06043.1 PTS ascorbate transporter subunit IIC [Senegalia massiliensis]
MSFIIDNLFRNPPVLLGIIAIIGLALQGKKIGDVIKGGLLAAIGMFILQQGVNILVGSIAPINGLFQEIAGGEVTEGLNDITFTSEFGGEVGLTMFFALVLHLLIARFTPIKTIFLTGHFLWWFPFIFVAAGVEGNLSGATLIIFATVLSALYWSIVPWLLKPFVSAVTGDDSFTLGHPSGILALISGFIAKKFGNKERSTESLKIPESLSFFKEVSITGGIVVFLMFLFLGLTVDGAFEAEAQPIVFYAINQGFMFGAGLVIMLQGVRMLVNQILPAFQGISEKLIPNSVPALDAPILFNYKPNAAIIGFVTAMVVSTIVILIANSFNVFGLMLIPLVITSFFECGAAAVIGEGQGGLRGAIIGTSFSAIVMVGLVGISAIIYSGTIQNWILIFGGNDLSLWGTISQYIAKLISLI